MQSIKCPEVSMAATVVGGVITVADTSKLYPTAPGALVTADGSSSVEIQIVEVLSATQVTARKQLVPNGTYQGPNYGLSDLSAFNGGTLTQYSAYVPVEYAYTKLPKA